MDQAQRENTPTDPSVANGPARRKRSPRRQGARTTLRVPAELAETAREYAEKLGTTPNDALVRFAERGAALYEGESEVARLAAERQAAVLAFDAPDPDADLLSAEEMDEVMRSTRGE